MAAEDQWIIEPFRSVGPLRFGASRREVQAIVDEVPIEFRKGGSPASVEAYNGVGFHAYYDSEGKLELIEAFPPCSISYAGIDLLATDTNGTLSQLRELGLDPRGDQSGVWFDECGFALYSPEGRTEGVSLFRRGYDAGD